MAGLQYGGSVEGRACFLLELVDACVAQVMAWMAATAYSLSGPSVPVQYLGHPMRVHFSDMLQHPSR